MSRANLKRQVMTILQQTDWHDFGLTFASEQLAQRHGIEVRKETLRKWMISAGFRRSRPSAAAGVVAISPDGTWIVFPIRGEDGKRLLATRLLEQAAITPLAGTENGSEKRHSEDAPDRANATN